MPTLADFRRMYKTCILWRKRSIVSFFKLDYVSSAARWFVLCISVIGMPFFIISGAIIYV